MIRRLIQRFTREEHGIALVLAIASMSILAITTTGVIIAGTANEDTALISMEERAAFAVAQQALAYGEGMVYADIQASPAITPPTTAQNLPTQPGGATGSYTASTTDNLTWHIVGTGTVRGITRTVSANVQPTQTVVTSQTALWNYLYEDSLNPPCVQGGAVITMPILARGNFCIQGNQTRVAGNLEVGGNLTSGGNANIGTSSSPISKLTVVGTCSVNTSSAVTVGTSPCDGTHNSSYFSSYSNTLSTTPTMPSADFTAAYTAQAARSKSGCPTNFFDNDSTLNNSNTSNIGNLLFGSTGYTCTVGTYSLKWTPSTNTLAVNGTFYFDGSLNMTGGNIVYTGQASLYFTGGVSMNGTKLCGVTNCTQSWDPNANLLVFVTQCTGINSKCVDLEGGANVQFAAWVKTDYFVAGNSINMGPVLCDTFQITGGTLLNKPFIDFPPGTPMNTTTVTNTGVAPSGWSG